MNEEGGDDNPWLEQAQQKLDSLTDRYRQKIEQELRQPLAGALQHVSLLSAKAMESLSDQYKQENENNAPPAKKQTRKPVEIDPQSTIGILLEKGKNVYIFTTERMNELPDHQEFSNVIDYIVKKFREDAFNTCTSIPNYTNQCEERLKQEWRAASSALVEETINSWSLQCSQVFPALIEYKYITLPAALAEQLEPKKGTRPRASQQKAAR